MGTYFLTPHSICQMAPRRAIEEVVLAPEDHWHHGEAAGAVQGGFKFLVGFDSRIHGEFEVEQRLRSTDPRWKWQYVPKAGSIYRYEPPRHYKELVRQMHFPEGFTEAEYDRFIGRTKLVKVS